ncbi:MAG: FISUMP domain-containing protein [Bacteroidota bacterium]
MKTNQFFLLLPVLFASVISVTAQKAGITIGFTGLDFNQYSRLDSIKITNIDQGSDTLLLYPDTLLTLEFPEGLEDPENNSSNFRMALLGNADGVVRAGIWMSGMAVTDLLLHDISGRLLCRTQKRLEAGFHVFRITAGAGSMILLTASTTKFRSSLKFLSCNMNGPETAGITYEGYEGIFPSVKMLPLDIGFSYRPGDRLIFSGYIGNPESGIWDIPTVDKTVVFQFANNIPCIDQPEVLFEGQVYHTVLIGSQCWLKENISAGTMIPVSQPQADNGIIEKYCYDDNPDHCILYGGLYQWGEAMQYIYTEGHQGLCPPGWHLATDLDWIVLEGVADALYGSGDEIWFGENARGSDAGNKLKSAGTWDSPGGTDELRFSALAGGFTYYGSFANQGAFAHFWTSSGSGVPDNPWLHWFRHDYSNAGRNYFNAENGRSVRCIKNQ